MTFTRTLILMRHAKSAYPGGVIDHDRPLADRGRHEAALAGDRLRATVPAVDETLCSSATRAEQTLAATGLAAPVRIAAEIYDATSDAILQQIRATADAVQSLLVIGHAPGVPGLAMELAGPGSDQLSLNGLESRFPTAAFAVMEYGSDWSFLDFGDARLVAFHIPRD